LNNVTVYSPTRKATATALLLLLLLTGKEINGDRNFLSALAEKSEIRTIRKRK
jgi:hypothetical protein